MHSLTPRTDKPSGDWSRTDLDRKVHHQRPEVYHSSSIMLGVPSFGNQMYLITWGQGTPPQSFQPVQIDYACYIPAHICVTPNFSLIQSLLASNTGTSC